MSKQGNLLSQFSDSVEREVLCKEHFNKFSPCSDEDTRKSLKPILGSILQWKREQSPHSSSTCHIPPNPPPWPLPHPQCDCWDLHLVNNETALIVKPFAQKQALVQNYLLLLAIRLHWIEICLVSVYHNWIGSFDDLLALPLYQNVLLLSALLMILS